MWASLRCQPCWQKMTQEHGLPPVAEVQEMLKGYTQEGSRSSCSSREKECESTPFLEQPSTEKRTQAWERAFTLEQEARLWTCCVRIERGTSHRNDTHSRRQVSLKQSPRIFSIPQVANTSMNTVFPVKREGPDRAMWRCGSWVVV